MTQQKTNVISNLSKKESFLDKLHGCTKEYSGCLADLGSFPGDNLEEKWSDIVRERITNKQKMQQSALWLFIKTEKLYINKLRIIVHLFNKIFNCVKDMGELVDVDECKIFSNIREILDSNERFWFDYLLPVVEATRKEMTAIIPSQLFIAFTKFTQIFTPYISYCYKEKACDNYIQNLICGDLTETGEDKEQSDFKVWLDWCESLSQSGHNKLLNLLKEPRLQLYRYGSLLKRVREKTSDISEVEFLAIIIQESDDFISQIDGIVDYFRYLDQLEEDESENERSFSTLTHLRTPLVSMNGYRYHLDTSLMKIFDEAKEEFINVEALLFSDVLIFAYRHRHKLKIYGTLFFLDNVVILLPEEEGNVIAFIHKGRSGSTDTKHLLEIDHDRMGKWISILGKAKRCYQLSICGEGSTADFFRSARNLPSMKAPSMDICNQSDTNCESTLKEDCDDDDLKNFTKKMT